MLEEKEEGKKIMNRWWYRLNNIESNWKESFEKKIQNKGKELKKKSVFANVFCIVL
jgi:hypothetical protein